MFEIIVKIRIVNIHIGPCEWRKLISVINPSIFCKICLGNLSWISVLDLNLSKNVHQCSVSENLVRIRSEIRLILKKNLWLG
jgi:hypothetical protein